MVDTVEIFSFKAFDHYPKTEMAQAPTLAHDRKPGFWRLPPVPMTVSVFAGTTMEDLSSFRGNFRAASSLFVKGQTIDAYVRRVPYIADPKADA
jgi:hypothetical protein